LNPAGRNEKDERKKRGGRLGGIAEMDSFFIRLLKTFFRFFGAREGFHSMKSELGDPAYKNTGKTFPSCGQETPRARFPK